MEYRNGKSCLVRSVLLTTVILLFVTSSHAQSLFSKQQYEADFDYLWRNISDHYAYFDQRTTDWNRVRETYRPKLEGVRTTGHFVRFLEDVLDELYDPHSHLNTNTASSRRLVPSGADIWAEWKGNSAVITEVRRGSAAMKSGIREGMLIESFNGIVIEEAVGRQYGKSLRRIDKEVRDWALRALLAGRRNEERRIAVVDRGARRAFLVGDEAATPLGEAVNKLLEYRRIEGNIGYIKINNALGDTNLIVAFDAALVALRDTRGLVLDLRDTPSGGNTTVARGILGRFIAREMPYQRHSIPAEERKHDVKRSWIELAAPRGDFTYKQPVALLVSHWTGSMGEGMAVGMDAMGRATVVGTRMAGLLGATSQITLPNTRIGVSFPTEKLFHVNGSPREDYSPKWLVDMLSKQVSELVDPVLEDGIKVLSNSQPVNRHGRR